MIDQTQQAWRLFNGFREGYPELSIDLYGGTAVFFLHKLVGREAETLQAAALDWITSSLPGVECVISKLRSNREPADRNGTVSFGSKPAERIEENHVLYALDLLMNQDASFYIDTRNLREWLKANSEGKSILNTFAYTGSLGVAALAGGAARVVQVDRSRKFLELARRSAMLNHLDLGRMNCIPLDFFVGVNQFKIKRELYDTVVLDPPYFSVTEKGRVDQATESARLINKVRPLVKDGGAIIVVNNALFLSGADFLHTLESLSTDGYLSIEQTIPIPLDAVGFDQEGTPAWPTDPAPFNHPTKIAVLRVKRKTSG